MSKTITLRVDDERAATLELVARAEDKSVNATLLEALDAHIESRRQDAEFQERLRRRHQEETALYKQLAS
jgi:predicted transcriptional regulator